MNNQLPDLPTIVEAERKMFGKYLLPIAITLIVIGLFGLLSPVILSAVTDGVLAAILIIAGFTWIIHSYQMHQHQLADWLKPVILLITGGIMIALPNAGIAAIGLMFILFCAQCLPQLHPIQQPRRPRAGLVYFQWSDRYCHSHSVFCHLAAGLAHSGRHLCGRKSDF